MLAKRMRLVVRAAAAISRLGDGTGPVGSQMMLEEPDLVDADAVRELDLFELAAEHLRMRRMFAGRGRRPDGNFHCFILPEWW